MKIVFKIIKKISKKSAFIAKKKFANTSHKYFVRISSKNSKIFFYLLLNFDVKNIIIIENILF